MSVRTELAEARIALRDAQDAYEETKAIVEQRIITSAGGAKELGSNAEERARALLLALQQDGDYIRMLAILREAQATVDRLQATLDDAIDARRADDRRSRDRLSAALERIGAHAEERTSSAVMDSIRVEPRAA